MTTLSLLLLPTLALAEAPSDSEWSMACAKTCTRTGFKIEIYESSEHSGSMLMLWNIWAHEYVDDAHYESGDVFLGVQSSTDPLIGGPYCTSYPGAGGHFIVGNVYDRKIDYDWEYVETGTLSQSPMVYCDASIDFLLDTLELYGTGTTDLPSTCTDIGCASGGGGGDDDPIGGSGTWGYTDAAGDEQSFDDLVDDDDPIAPTTTTGTVSRSR